jgi:hypothetical protein
MTATPDWSTVGAIIGALAPLVGAPLAMIALYLRAIREAQAHHEAVDGRRVGVIEGDVRRVGERLDEVERSYTTKAEWLRESLHARQQLERLTELMAEVRSQLDHSQGIAAQLAEATRAMVELTRALVETSKRQEVESSQEGCVDR